MLCSPNIYLVGGIPTPLKNMSSSVGMMTFPYIYIWNVIIHSCSSQHQPAMSSDVNPPQFLIKTTISDALKPQKNHVKNLRNLTVQLGKTIRVTTPWLPL